MKPLSVAQELRRLADRLEDVERWDNSAHDVVPDSPAGLKCSCCAGDGRHYDEHWRNGGSPSICQACTDGLVLPGHEYSRCRRSGVT